GVFVNALTPAIQSIDESVGLNLIQLHGDETVDACVQTSTTITSWRIKHWEKQMESFPVHPALVAKVGKRLHKAHQWATGAGFIRARRSDDRGVAAIAEDLNALTAAGCQPMAVLVDAATPGRYGGTGETVSWIGLADHKRWLGDVPLILAGGLTPEN